MAGHDNGAGPRASGASAATRVATVAAAGACAGVIAALPGSWQIGTLVGWDVAAGLYVAWTWKTIWRRDPAATGRLALREDPGRATADALLLVASVASVLAVALAISAGHAGGAGSPAGGSTSTTALQASALRAAARSSWPPPSTW